MLLGSFIKSRKLIVTFVLLKLNRVWFKSMLWSQQPVKSRKRLAIWLSHIYSKYRYKRSRNRICEGKFALLSQTNTFTLLLSSYPNVDICSQVDSLLNTPLVLSLHTRLSRFVNQFVTVYMHWSPISPANGMKCVQTMIAQYALESRNAILHSNHCCFWNIQCESRCVWWIFGLGKRFSRNAFLFHFLKHFQILSCCWTVNRNSSVFSGGEKIPIRDSVLFYDLNRLSFKCLNLFQLWTLQNFQKCENKKKLSEKKIKKKI